MYIHETVFANVLGKMLVKAHFRLKPGVRPVRQVPYALLHLVDKELKRWVAEVVAMGAAAGGTGGRVHPCSKF